MVWLKYFDISLYASLICVALGVASYFLMRRPDRHGLESLPHYCTCLVLADFLTSFVGFAAGFFGPVMLLPGDPLPFWGIFVTGPLGAFAGLIAFWAFAFRPHRGQTGGGSR